MILVLMSSTHWGVGRPVLDSHQSGFVAVAERRTAVYKGVRGGAVVSSGMGWMTSPVMGVHVVCRGKVVLHLFV